ncbi:unnamed protein product [Vitrella brassicaformis CCMP3155]|uniref:Ketosynthase family 3 (KS3) domain-containing protein n=1 Tax=Vitrella brassicaformis (strain CCMP3155) TaxID=1169540 RepID=A0A0G4GRG5_VITBC|nr:unnamed protein product [Vitrella brassicaformis CCMP3155]|eukprot:CEM33147.1 unnamed protein product [Vitrella brassicaformis CCMP3155]
MQRLIRVASLLPSSVAMTDALRNEEQRGEEGGQWPAIDGLEWRLIRVASLLPSSVAMTDALRNEEQRGEEGGQWPAIDGLEWVSTATWLLDGRKGESGTSTPAGGNEDMLVSASLASSDASDVIHQHVAGRTPPSDTHSGRSCDLASKIDVTSSPPSRTPSHSSVASPAGGHSCEVERLQQQIGDLLSSLQREAASRQPPTPTPSDDSHVAFGGLRLSQATLDSFCVRVSALTSVVVSAQTLASHPTVDALAAFCASKRAARSNTSHQDLSISAILSVGDVGDGDESRWVEGGDGVSSWRPPVLLGSTRRDAMAVDQVHKKGIVLDGGVSKSGKIAAGAGASPDDYVKTDGHDERSLPLVLDRSKSQQLIETGRLRAALEDAVMGVVSRSSHHGLPQQEGDTRASLSLQQAGIGPAEAVTLRNRLLSEFNVDVEPSVMLEAPTLRDLIYVIIRGLIDVIIERELWCARNAGTEAIEASVSLSSLTGDDGQSVAVMGMACRFPGGSHSPAAFWETMMAKEDCMGCVPLGRWDHERVFDEDRSAPGKTCARLGGFVLDAAEFDAGFFELSTAEVRDMDPQQRLLLECGYEALVDAGFSRGRLMGASVGVAVGGNSYDWLLTLKDRHKSTAFTGIGSSPAILANRLSYAFGLTGPSLTIDSATSASLVAVDSAVRFIKMGQCRTALAAGVTLMLSPYSFIAFSRTTDSAICIS